MINSREDFHESKNYIINVAKENKRKVVCTTLDAASQKPASAIITNTTTIWLVRCLTITYLICHIFMQHERKNLLRKFLFRITFILTAINENIVPARVCVHITVHWNTTVINQSERPRHAKNKRNKWKLMKYFLRQIKTYKK